jgi:N utilization substance protein A
MTDDDTSLIARLVAQEVPEIAAGRVAIKAIARSPGYRSKIALQSHDPSVDCIAACVGLRGFRIKNVVDVLGGERIDLIRWDDAPERLIVNALEPAVIEKVILHAAEHRAVVVVKPDQLSLAIGRRGLNRELASQLSRWQIEVEETQDRPALGK